MIQACQHEKHSNQVSNNSSNYQIKLPNSSINSNLVLKQLNFALLIVKVLNSSFDDSHINKENWNLSMIDFKSSYETTKVSWNRWESTTSTWTRLGIASWACKTSNLHCWQSAISSFWDSPKQDSSKMAKTSSKTLKTSRLDFKFEWSKLVNK